MRQEQGYVVVDSQNPWPGLASYDEKAAAFFQGRDQDSADLYRLIKRSNFVALFGKSGLGKSSLLQAGTFPRLWRDNFMPVYLRLDYTQLELLDQVLARVVEVAQEFARKDGADVALPHPGEGLWAWLQRESVPIWTHDNFQVTPILVFDQFEELFSRGGSVARIEKVLLQLADLIGNRIPTALAVQRGATQALNLRSQQYCVVLSFRSDFLAEVETWARKAGLPRRESLHLTAMSRERAIAAIEKAGRDVIETGCATRIVDFLVEREGSVERKSREVEPVLLSLCCYQLNISRKQQGRDRVDAELVARTGRGILRAFYDDALQELPSRVAEFIEDKLIFDRFRNPVPLQAVLDTGQISQVELDQLIAKRLLRKDTQGDDIRIELIHDRIVSVVRDSRDIRLARVAQERKAAEQARMVEIERERSANEVVQRKKAERSLRNVTLRWALPSSPLAWPATSAGDRTSRPNGSTTSTRR
jgi:hypothetical protein